MKARLGALLFGFVLVWAPVAVCSAAGQKVEVCTVPGEVVEGQAVTFEEGGGVLLRGAGSAGERRFGPDELVGVRLAPPLALRGLQPGLVLRSGEVCWGRVQSLSSEAAVVVSPLLGTVRFTRSEVAAVVCEEGVSLADLSAAPAGEVALRNGDRVQGTLQSIQGGAAKVRTDLGELDISLDRLSYLKLAPFPPAWKPQEKACQVVVLAEGDWLLGEIAGEAEGRLTVRRGGGAAGDAAEAELSIPKSAVSEVRYLGGRVVYLSDLEPREVAEQPFFDYLLPWQRDLSVMRTRLSLRGRLFYKGLGVHSRCRLTYDLGGRYCRFHSLVGIDDAARGRGNCTFEVWVDGDRRLASGPVTGRDPPRTVEVDVSGARELVLLVDFGEAGDVADRADWADAYLVEAEAAATVAKADER